MQKQPLTDSYYYGLLQLICSGNGRYMSLTVGQLRDGMYG